MLTVGSMLPSFSLSDAAKGASKPTGGVSTGVGAKKLDMSKLAGGEATQRQRVERPHNDDDDDDEDAHTHHTTQARSDKMCVF